MNELWLGIAIGVGSVFVIAFVVMCIVAIVMVFKLRISIRSVSIHTDDGFESINARIDDSLESLNTEVKNGMETSLSQSKSYTDQRIDKLNK